MPNIGISVRINQVSGTYGAVEAHFHVFLSHKQFIQAPRALNQSTALGTPYRHNEINP